VRLPNTLTKTLVTVMTTYTTEAEAEAEAVAHSRLFWLIRVTVNMTVCINKCDAL
jgi:hypothetical protein